MVHACAPRASAPRAGQRGFTLVELMVTVLIVGILAVAAYAGYHKFVTSSHQAEAHAMLSGIKNRQEAYKAETGTGYMDFSAGLAANQNINHSSLYPHCVSSVAEPGAFSVAWSQTPCGACCKANQDWLKLKVESTAPTFYGYSTIAGATGVPVTSMKISGNAVNWPASNVSPWFVATAVGDVDGNGVFSTVMISSFDNSVWIDNENE